MERSQEGRDAVREKGDTVSGSTGEIGAVAGRIDAFGADKTGAELQHMVYFKLQGNGSGLVARVYKSRNIWGFFCSLSELSEHCFFLFISISN